MEWHRLLRLIAVTAIVLISIGVPAQAAFAVRSDRCGSLNANLGGCQTDVSAGIEGDEAILTGNQGGPRHTTGGMQHPFTLPIHCQIMACDPNGVLRQEFTVITVTLNDLVGFRPTAGVDHMEPNGWMIVGLDTNFFATGDPHIETGTLLGLPAAVRFTPVLWHWTYGDGTSATRRIQGSTWRSQSIAEFDPTQTSHVYERAGTYNIDLTVSYSVEYTFNGSDWGTIVGTITVPANRLVATVGDAKTVLVQRECTANPHGPGC